MCRKLAIYVEGQTEQVLLNWLILTWWSYCGIKIENIKLCNDLKNPVPNFDPGPPYNIHFVIINVEGMGSLASAIAQRAEKQIINCFNIIGLRDLDFENIKRQVECIQQFKSALKILRSCHADSIDLYFAIVEIEAWMLAFHKAVSRWADVSEKEILKAIESKNCPLEQIRKPSGFLAEIGKKRGKDTKSYHEIQSFVSGIDREMIEEVYQSNLVPSFNKFWNKITG